MAGALQVPGWGGGEVPEPGTDLLSEAVALASQEILGARLPQQAREHAIELERGVAAAELQQPLTVLK